MKLSYQIFLLSCLFMNIVSVKINSESKVKPQTKSNTKKNSKSLKEKSSKPHNCYVFTINPTTNRAEAEFKNLQNVQSHETTSTNKNMVPANKDIQNYTTTMLNEIKNKTDLTKPEVMAMPILEHIRNNKIIDSNVLDTIKKSQGYNEHLFKTQERNNILSEFCTNHIKQIQQNQNGSQKIVASSSNLNELISQKEESITTENNFQIKQATVIINENNNSSTQYASNSVSNESTNYEETKTRCKYESYEDNDFTKDNSPLNRSIASFGFIIITIASIIIR